MSSEANTGARHTTDGSSGSGADTATAGGVTTVYQVTGMTCGHCEGAVSEEIGSLRGVTSVKAVAPTGQVTVTSAAPLDDEAVRTAVDEAGFELVGRA